MLGFSSSNSEAATGSACLEGITKSSVTPTSVVAGVRDIFDLPMIKCCCFVNREMSGNFDH